MKLIKCYISSFGKLKNVSFDFTDGLNVILQDNGFGKSTLALFIKCMFYGVVDGKRSISANERQRFKPWGSTEKFGGYVVFSTPKGEFRLERFFGNKSAEDEVNLYNNTTGVLLDKIDNIGNKLFGIDEDGFTSTLYFSENDLEVKGSSSLTAKYNRNVDVIADDNVDEILAKIKKEYSEYKYSGERGKIWDSHRAITNLQLKLTECEHYDEEIESLTANENAVSNELKNLTNSINQLTEKLKIAGKNETIILKRNRLNVLNSQLDNLVNIIFDVDNKLGHNDLTIEQLSACKRAVAELNDLKNKLQEFKNQLTNQIIKNESQPKAPQNVKGKMFYALSGGLGLAGVLLAIFSMPLASGILLALAVVSGVLGFVLSKNKKVQPVEDNLQPLKTQIQDIEKLIEDSQNKISNFLSPYYKAGEEYLDTIYKLEMLLNEKSRLIIDKKGILTEIENLSSDSDLGLTTDNVESVDTLKNSLDKLNETYTEKANQLSKIKSNILELERALDNREVVESKLFEEKERKAKLEEEFLILQTTYKLLSTANENQKLRYKEPLTNSFNKYIKMLVGDSTIADIDTDFNVTIDENGTKRVMDYYSKGYKNLFNACRRFALIDVLYGENKPFIILDDPFMSFDKDKLNYVLSLIKGVAKDMQIIYLTCHKSRTEGL